MELPTQFKEAMKELLQEEYDAYLESFNDERNYALRVNNLKIETEDFLKLFPYPLKPIPWIPNGFYYNEEDPVSKHPYYYAGLYYLQDASAMTPANILPIEEGDLVLDGCAAPGGKSTELASKLKGTGLLISNDISTSRCLPLSKNLERFGVTNAYVISEDLSKLEAKYSNYFDKILIDAPCSGEGMFRKEPSMVKTWLEKGVDYYVSLQKPIIKAALNMLKDGGMLVYSTCTFAKKEDEEILAYAESICPSLKLSEVKRYPGFSNGLAPYKDAIRLYPHKVKGEGHFVALLQKGEGQRQSPQKTTYKPLQNEEVLDFLSHIKKEYNGTFEIKKDLVLYTPNIEFNTKGLRVIRSGLLMGELIKKRFEPSQALAYSLKKEEFDQVINLKADDPKVMRYLKGETIEIEDTSLKGWVLVCVDSYPLGFAKALNGILKNKLEKGSRIQ